MKNFEDIDIERQIHDSVLLDEVNRKEKLVKFISKNFRVPEEQLENNKALIDVIMQLRRESNPMIYEFNEDIWNFLAINMEAEDNEIPDSREVGKNGFYNRSKAKAYIDTYFENYNPVYPTFHGGGGDCANFVSQVIYAGGMPWVDDGNPNHYTWFTNWYCKPGASNKDGDKRISLSWKVAASFKRHFEKRAAKQVVISYKDAIDNMKDLSRQVFVGDPVQFCYANGTPYHTLIVTGYAWDKPAGLNDIVLASHTINSNRRSLYNTMKKYPKDYQLRFYVIKEGA
ncbi:MAG TPA: amidase domain-containing protein [Methanosarcinales archaeon]|nr:amidase domain-containing protein [Methanosarcinales archaeon]